VQVQISGHPNGRSEPDHDALVGYTFVTDMNESLMKLLLPFVSKAKDISTFMSITLKLSSDEVASLRGTISLMPSIVK
jgi:hypothetical protein